MSELCSVVNTHSRVQATENIITRATGHKVHRVLCFLFSKVFTGFISKNYANSKMDTPRKYLIKDLINKPVPANVWLQGTIEQAVKNEILIVSDGSGRAKITKCEAADGIIDRSSLRKEAYFCIIGTAVKTSGLPEIQASKLVDLTAQIQMKTAWETEIKEADLFLEGRLSPAV